MSLDRRFRQDLIDDSHFLEIQQDLLRVFLDSFHGRSARKWNNPRHSRSLTQRPHPSYSDLGHLSSCLAVLTYQKLDMDTYGTAFTLRNFLDLIHKLHILMKDIRLKPGTRSAHVVLW
jgi:hypothetical protein